MGQKPTRSVTRLVSKVFCFPGPFIGAYPIGGKIGRSRIRHPHDLLTLSRRAGSPRAYPIEPAKWSHTGLYRIRIGGRFYLLNPIGEDLIRLRSYKVKIEPTRSG